MSGPVSGLGFDRLDVRTVPLPAFWCRLRDGPSDSDGSQGPGRRAERLWDLIGLPLARISARIYGRRIRLKLRIRGKAGQGLRHIDAISRSGRLRRVASQVEPDSFDPLGVNPHDPAAAIHYARNRVKNIVESYHGRFDLLAEAVQNAVDAIEARWNDWNGTDPPDATTSPDERPTLLVRIHTDTNLIEIIDNGIGIAAHAVVDSLIPNVSPKAASDRITRGHKGVGTTFLAYRHNDFRIHTKHYATGQPSEVAYELKDGIEWVQSDAMTPAPRFVSFDPPSEQLPIGRAARMSRLRPDPKRRWATCGSNSTGSSIGS
jgi:hypothetical protein